jgi:hypothetical protein
VEPAPRPRWCSGSGRLRRAEGVRCLDLLPTIARAGPGAFLDYDHLSPSGSQLVADTLRASGLLAEAVSDPLTLRQALARLPEPGAGAAARWLETRRFAGRVAAVAIAGAAGQAALGGGQRPGARRAGATPQVPALARCLRQDAPPACARAARGPSRASARAPDAALFVARRPERTP